MTPNLPLLPPATIGIIGGGQLGKMLAQSAVTMGYQPIVLDPTPQCSASAVAQQIVGDYDNLAAAQELADRADVVTYEFENVDVDTIKSIAQTTFVPQGTRALEISQNRLSEKSFLEQIGVQVAPYRRVSSKEDLERAATEIGLPAVLKTSTGGYDGKGQVVLKPGDGSAWQDALTLAGDTECVLEEWVPFKYELSVIVAGNGQGEYVSFPPSANEHRNNILYRSVVPGQISDKERAAAVQLALQVAEAVGLVGVMGIEMFATTEGGLVVNELAPRPHNSGHYTIEACDLSQFDAHILGVCGLPLPVPQLLAPATMVNILGQDQEETLQRWSEEGGWNLHLYGKGEARTDRKMGHLTRLD